MENPYDPERVITFYADLPLDELDNLETYIKNYIDADESRYLIAHEIGRSGKSHFHFVVEMEITQYNKFRDAILIKKYKLSAKKKQYGKVNEILKLNKLLSYCLKDKGAKRTNVPDEELQPYISASFRKNEEKEDMKECLEKIPKMPNKYEYTDSDILAKKIYIIDFYRKKKKSCNFNKCDRIFQDYLNQQEQLSSTQVYELMRQNRNNRL